MGSRPKGDEHPAYTSYGVCFLFNLQKQTNYTIQRILWQKDTLETIILRDNINRFSLPTIYEILKVDDLF